MKRYLISALLLLVCVFPLFAQGTGKTSVMVSGASDPATCVAGKEFYFNSASSTIRYCKATNTWVGIADLTSTGLTTDFIGMTQNTFGGGHDTSTITYGIMRFWDTAGVAGLIETANGTFNWTNFDAQVTYAASKNSIVDFVWGRWAPWAITGTPTGTFAPSTGAQLASDIDGVNALTPAFFTALVGHMQATFPGVKYIIEGRNESDLAGTCAENSSIGGHCSMVHLVKEQKAIYQTVKALDPTVEVDCPSASTFNHFGAHLYAGTDATSAPFSGSGFIAAGGGVWCDNYNVHPYFFTGSNYQQTPEEAVNGCANSICGGGLGQLKALLGSNIIDSETDWGSNVANTMSDALQVAWMGRYFVYAWNAGHKRIIWYGWDNNSANLSVGFGTLCKGTSGSCTPDSATVTAYTTLTDIFIGSSHIANPTPCVITSSVQYACNIVLNTVSGKTGPALIVFTNDGSTPSISTAGFSKIYKLDGTDTATTGTLTLNGNPAVLHN